MSSRDLPIPFIHRDTWDTSEDQIRLKELGYNTNIYLGEEHGPGELHTLIRHLMRRLIQTEKEREEARDNIVKLQANEKIDQRYIFLLRICLGVALALTLGSWLFFFFLPYF